MLDASNSGGTELPSWLKVKKGKNQSRIDILAGSSSKGFRSLAWAWLVRGLAREVQELGLGRLSLVLLLLGGYFQDWSLRSHSQLSVGRLSCPGPYQLHW